MNRRPVLFISLWLGVFTFAIFWPVVHNGFVNYDDGLYVTENPWVQQGLTLDGAAWALGATHASNWHPVVWLSHMTDCSLFGMFPGGHHLTNLLLHVLNTVLLFLLLHRLTRATWRSGVVAALFAWHPLHVESVAWIAERKDLLSTLFWILSVWAYAHYVERPGWRRYSMVLLFFALGLMSKPMLVTLPFVLLLLDFWPLGRIRAALPSGSGRDGSVTDSRKSWLNLLLEKLPFFMLSAASCVVTIWVQDKGGAVKSLEALSLPLRLANSVTAYGGYLWKMIWPSDLAVLYPMPTHAPLIGALCWGLVLTGISVFAVRMRQRQPALIVGWFWYLGMLVPVIGLVQVGAQAMADRYSYLPLVGIFICVVWGLGDWNWAWARGRNSVGRCVGDEVTSLNFIAKDQSLVTSSATKRGWIKAAAAGLALVACAWGTSQQLQYWRDGTALFAHAVGCTKGNYIAHNNLGTALASKGRSAEAMDEYAKALRFNPNYAQAHFNLATEFAEQGNTTEAVNHLNAILRLAPKEAEAHNNLGVVFARQGKLSEAVEQFSTTVRLKPDYLKAHLNLAMALAKQGKTAEAIGRYRVALRVEPQSPEPLDKLAWILATNPEAKFRDGAQAVRLAQRAAALSSDPVPGYVDTLAAAYAEAGLFSEAVSAGQKALHLASRTGPKELSAQIESRLQLYSEGKPFHESE